MSKHILKSKTTLTAITVLLTNVAAAYGIIIPPEFFDSIAQITAVGLPILMIGLRAVTDQAVKIFK